MPHSTSPASSVRDASSNPSSALKAYGETQATLIHGAEKFPDFDSAPAGRSASPRNQDGNNGSAHPGDRWQPRRDSRANRMPNERNPGQNRQRRISNAIRHIRSGSVGQNAHEIAGALRAPVSYKLILLCLTWYWSSALTNTSSKSILTAFDKPATLTIVQFAFVSTFCLLSSWLASTFPWLRASVPALRHPLRRPSKEVITTTMPLAVFQIGGHLLSSTATSKISVSLVHTIKGLSPLFTVLAYRFVYNIRYPWATYYSLVPLTVGVMLACSGNHTFQGEFLGIFYALLATIIFVTQNIFSKRLFNEAALAEEQNQGAKSRKLDKLNLLCYSSGLALVATGPIWFWTEGVEILGDFLHDGAVDLTAKSANSFDHGRLILEFIFNGIFHFGQNILAFILLSAVSPVTYSVASLIKRVFVIIIAIIWFRSPTTGVQAVGVGLTFVGLYLYDRSSEKNKADQRARTMTESRRERPLLPLNVRLANNSQPVPVFESPATPAHPYTAAQSYPSGSDTKKLDDPVQSRGASGTAGWLPPGTKQEDTWRPTDAVPAAS